MRKFRTCTIVPALAISGCTNVPTTIAPDTKAANGVDGLPCFGNIDTTVPGLVESGNTP